jgi:poly-beta-1,6-N-acetyl-D-glucosamine synthase
MTILAAIFLVCFTIVFYTYIGYPLIVGLLAALKRAGNMVHTPTGNSFEPEVALVIPCFNEAYILEQKVNNCMELDYPKQKLEIFFITDGSTDNSAEVLGRYKQVKVLHEAERRGKAAAENRAMHFVKAPVVIFCDANTVLNRDAVRHIVKHFSNEKVGAVAGEKRVLVADKNSASSAGEGVYWKYESWLKKQDSNLHTVAGGAGELIAFRRSCFKPLKEDTILDDFVASMQIAIDGYKVVYEPCAYAQENASASVGEETKRKIRIAAGAWQAFFRLPQALNPIHDIGLTFIYISHKVMRWSMAPLALLIMIPLGYILHVKVGGWFTVFWIAQQLFYFMAIMGKIMEHRQLKIKLFFIPYYFVVTNWCMIAGFVRYVKGNQSVKWEKAQRIH